MVKDSEHLRRRSYQTREVCEIVGVEQREVRYWADKAVIVPEVRDAQGRPGIRREYSYNNLIEFAIIKRLVRRGINLRKAKEILREINKTGYFETSRIMFLLIYDDDKVNWISIYLPDTEHKDPSGGEYLVSKDFLELIRGNQKEKEKFENVLHKAKSGSIERLKELLKMIFQTVLVDDGVYVLPLHHIKDEINKKI